MKKTYIYGLHSIDEPDIIRYVGKADNPMDRLLRHIRDTKLSVKKNKKLTHKENWIIKSEYLIGLSIIESCKYSDWPMIEKFYILTIPNLTNGSSGGKGGGPKKFNITYDELKDWVSNNLSCKSKNQWVDYVKSGRLPSYIPPNPEQKYKKCGWTSWGDFLNSGNVFSNDVSYITLSEAIEMIKPMAIENSVEYKKMHKLGILKNVPYRPERYYSNLGRGWTSWSNFLSCMPIRNKKFISLSEFIEFCKLAGINKNVEFKKFMKENPDRIKKNLIPTNPNIIYKKNWLGWTRMDEMKKNLGRNC
jgi:hypothetical protein